MSSNPIPSSPENSGREFRNALYKMQLQSKMCDVILVSADGQELPAHQNVLAIASPFFDDWFAAHPPNAIAGAAKRIPLTGMTLATLRAVVQHLYTGRANATGATVHALLGAAATLQLPSLRAACLQLLATKLLRPDTCVAVRRLAVLHDSAVLRTFADVYMRQHSAVVVRSPLFGRLVDGLPAAEAVNMLARVDTDAACSESVSEAAISQIANEVTRRVVMESRNGLTKPNTNVAMVKKPASQILMVVDKDRVQCYDIDEKEWYDLEENRPSLGGWPNGALSHNGRIYIITNDLKNVEVFDPVTEKWTMRDFGQPAVERGNNNTLAMLNGYVYLLGGYLAATETYLDRVDRFDVVDNVSGWRTLRPMLTARHFGSAIAMDGQLYVVGGVNGESQLASAERYDPLMDTWHPIASMSFSRYRAGIAALDGKIYVMGGNDGWRSSLKSMEVYDPQTDRWSRAPDMSVERGRVAVVVHAGELYVMGGCAHLTVEVFCPATKTWRILAETMPKKSLYTVACLFDEVEDDD